MPPSYTNDAEYLMDLKNVLLIDYGLTLDREDLIAFGKNIDIFLHRLLVD